MAAAGEDKMEGASGVGSGGSSGSGKLTLALTTVNLIATFGMIAILFISYQREKHRPAITDIAAHVPGVAKDVMTEAAGAKNGGKDAKGNALKKPVEAGKMVTLEQFTVNLATPGSVNPKFVRVNISLEVPTEDAESEVNTKMPQVRNAIIDLFNSKRPTDLATADGRDYLKEEIRSALNGFLVSGKVKGVFFTNFALSS